MRPTTVFGLVFVSASVACATPPTAMAHAQETAQQANLDARFGRNELVMEHVAPAARDAYAAHHRGWGTTVRVADLELAGMRAGSEHDVEVIVRVAWYRPEEEELHVTTLKQDWREAGGWQLVSEQRLAGDVGLLGETVVFESPREPRPPAQFPTIRLGGAEE